MFSSTIVSKLGQDVYAVQPSSLPLSFLSRLLIFLFVRFSVVWDGVRDGVFVACA